MSQRVKKEILRYGLVPLAIGAALLLRFLLAPILQAEVYFLFLWPAVILCAWYGGFGPGVLATLLAAAAANFFYFDPLYSLTITNRTELIVMAVFVTIGCLVSLLSEHLHRSNEQLGKQTQEVSRQAESLRVILASIGDAVLVTNAQGQVSFLNPAAQAVTGWSEKEAIGRPAQEVFRIISEIPLRSMEHPVTVVLRDGKSLRLAEHMVVIGRDGSAKPIEGNATPMRGTQGNLLGVVVSFLDATERRHAAEARTQLAAIVETSDDAIVSRTLDGIITTWNLGATQLYGYTAEEMLGKPIALLVPRDRAAELPVVMERVKKGERVSPFTTVRVCKDGTLVELSISIAPLKNEAGKVVGAAVIARRLKGA